MPFQQLSCNESIAKKINFRKFDLETEDKKQWRFG